LVPLKEEVSVVEEYLQFQKLRFGDRLSWSIRISDSAAPFPVPRFTLQPFVENAVRHGIEPKEEGGTVEIRVLKRHEMIYITVRDTGIGMPELGIDGLDRGDKRAEGIGIANVRKRLALRYGERARLSIKSEHGRGTLVRISLPLEIQDSETTYGG
jgi:sensor histidine kinase YesM